MLGLGGFFAVPVCFQGFPGSGPKNDGGHLSNMLTL